MMTEDFSNQNILDYLFKITWNGLKLTAFKHRYKIAFFKITYLSLTIPGKIWTPPLGNWARLPPEKWNLMLPRNIKFQMPTQWNSLKNRIEMLSFLNKTYTEVQRLLSVVSETKIQGSVKFLEIIISQFWDYVAEFYIWHQHTEIRAGLLTGYRASWCLPNIVSPSEKSSHWEEGWTGLMPGPYVA